MAQTVKLRRSASPGTPPTTSQLALGELAINTYDGKLFLKKNVSGTESIVEIGANNLADTFQVYEYSVTSNTTVFQGSDDNSNTLSYTTGSPPRVAVFLNGLLLDWGTDFTATNGSSVTLTSAAVSGDLVQIQAYKSTVVAGSNLMFNDNIKAQFGNDGDLEIYHDASNSYIADVGTGSLNIDTNGLGMSFRHTGSGSNKNMMQLTQYGATIHYDNSVKLTTTAAGATVTGDLTVSGEILASAGSVSAPSITFDTDTNTGLYRYTGGSEDRLGITTAGAQRVNFGSHGVESTANVYTGSGSAFRNYGGTWAGTTGVAGNGFYFLNTANSNTTKAMELTHDGSVLFPGEIRSDTRVKTDMITGIQQTGSFLDFDDDTTQNTNGVTLSSLAALSMKFDTNNNDSGGFNVFGNGQSTAYLSVDNNGDLIALSGNLTFKEVTGTSSYTQIKKTNTGSNLALVSQESIYMMLDANNDQTNRSFQIVKNADAPGSGNTLFVVEEDGDVISYGNVEVDTTNPQLTFRPDDGILFRFRVDESANRLELGHSSNKNLYLSNTGNATFNYDLGVSGDLTVGGNTTITGNLTVNGTQTVLNTATLSVDDLNITIADGAANAAAADGAGITVDGANATLTYTSADDEWNFNKNLVVGGKETSASFPLMVKSNTAHQAFSIEENSGAESFQIGVDASGDLNFYNSGSTTPMLKLNDGNNLVLGHTSYTAQHSQNIGGNTDRLMAVTSNTAGQTVGYHLGVNDGSRNSRVKLFMTDDATAGNRAFGIHQTWSSGGGAPFVISMGTSERLRIDTSGNVGIGTTTPDEFGIGGSFKYLAVGGDKPGILNLVDDGTNGSYLQFGNAAGLRRASIHADNSSDLVITLNSSNSGTSLTERLRIKASTGNVGIGVDDPATRLEVKHDSNASTGITVENTSTGTAARAMVEFKSDAAQLNVYATGSNYSGVTGWADAGVLSTSSTTTGGLILNTQSGGIKFQYGTTERMRIHTNGYVGIGDVSPDFKLAVRTPAIPSGSTYAWPLDLSRPNTDSRGLTFGIAASGTTNAIAGHNADVSIGHTYGTDSNGLPQYYETLRVKHIDQAVGNVGIGVTDPKAKFQVEEYGIDTTETSTSATTQTVIHTMSASDFRSARFTIQVTNSTDSTYHTTEILMVHDGTTANITEFGKVFTANEEATFDADVSSGNVRLLATPATTDSMEFKVVCHSITV